jgi:translation initiation factor IF-3
MLSSKELLVNEQIRAREVRVIDDEGQRGVMSLDEALRRAHAAGLDLVEVSPKAVPPVCRIVNYGKFKFELEKKVREAKRKQKSTQLKEIRMQPMIQEHDMAFKTKHIREFLDQGNKVKVSVRFRGRQLAHLDNGRKVLQRICELLGDSHIVEKTPQMEGRQMSMILSPKHVR